MQSQSGDYLLHFLHQPLEITNTSLNMLPELGCVMLGSFTFPFLFTQFDKRLDLMCDSRRYEISLRLVSAIQSILCVVVGYISMKNTESDIVYDRYPLINWYTWFWLPYFYYDAWAMYKVYTAKPEKVKGQTNFIATLKGFILDDPLMMLHHLVLPLIYGPAILYFRKGKGDYFIGCAFLMELTIPFISARQILLELGLKKTKAYMVNGILLMVSFGLVRLGIWFYLVNCYAIYRQVSFGEGFLLLPTVCKCGLIFFALMNLYWFIKISNKVVKYFR
ncbi:TLC domain-containing protein 3A-like [Watersipora subatra]|uniref:TLC domain-containing protein 3A-like n=1 Tax=Watersipora subatra TaxID=2589382 RepID=UPI00355BA4CB